jgi:hypothetical protein
MQTRIEDLRGPAVVGSLAALGWVAVWQLGVEFERAWMRSYDGPLLDETLTTADGEALQPARSDQTSAGGGEHRRWVIEHHPRAVTGTASVTRPDRG